MTIITSEWLRTPAIQRVFALLSSAGHQVFAVGGCVRNSLLDRPVSDIDMATDADPDRVLALAQGADLRAVPTGYAHGTITLLVEGQSIEVTTFRDDIETDGRHAVVRFSDDLTTDARRRDFTMNALYADRSGRVLDPVNGLRDIAQRRVRFIGYAEDRLVEDYLRALRYFRFLAWYGDPELGADIDALAAISAQLEQIRQVSRERITAEMLKLLAAPEPSAAVGSMSQIGLINTLFGGGDAAMLARYCHAERSLSIAIDPIARLVALSLAHPEEDLRLSRAQSKQLRQLQNARSSMQPPAALGNLLGCELGGQALALRSAIFETPPNPAALQDMARGAEAVFPVHASDLMPEIQGAELGETLDTLKQAWIASDFTLTREALLNLR